jgi:hypothetical protein
MPQIVTTQDPQPADVVRDLAAKGSGTTLRLVQTAPPTTQHPASDSAAAVTIQGNGTLAHFWLDQAAKQVTCTAQTLGKLATARGWRERLEIQNDFVSGSLTWLNEGMARYAAVTSAMVAHAREARVGAAAAPASSR